MSKDEHPYESAKMEVVGNLLVVGIDPDKLHPVQRQILHNAVEGKVSMHIAALVATLSPATIDFLVKNEERRRQVEAEAGSGEPGPSE